VLTGQVINATTNTSVGDVEVTLHVFQGDSEIETLTTLTDSTGNYTFEELSTDHAVFYMLEGKYQDITYLSDEPGIFIPGSTQTTLNLKVYDSTASDAAISLTQLHYMISFSPNAVNVVQIFVVGNSGNRTYIGQNNQTFSFSLPKAATGVTFQNDAGDANRFIQTDQGYIDTRPVIPGKEGLSIVAFYDIPYADDTLTIEAPLSTDVTELNVLMSDQAAKLSSEQLQFVETRQFQGNSFVVFKGENLIKGETLTFELAKLDELEFNAPEGAGFGEALPSPTSPVDQTLLSWIVFGLGGLVIVVASVGYPMVRRRLMPPADVDDEAAQAQRQKLLLTLAQLDKVFEAGNLDETSYRQARANYKAELIRVMGRAN
jgi:hypothetical protein